MQEFGVIQLLLSCRLFKDSLSFSCHTGRGYILIMDIVILCQRDYPGGRDWQPCGTCLPGGREASRQFCSWDDSKRVLKRGKWGNRGNTLYLTGLEGSDVGDFDILRLCYLLGSGAGLCVDRTEGLGSLYRRPLGPCHALRYMQALTFSNF